MKLTNEQKMLGVTEQDVERAQEQQAHLLFLVAHDPTSAAIYALGREAGYRQRQAEES